MKAARSRSPKMIQQLGLAAILGLLGYFSARVGPIRDDSPLFWLPSGAGLAVLVKFGLGWWPSVILGAAPSAVIQSPVLGGIGPMISILLGNSIGVIVSAWLLRHRLSFQSDMQRIKDVVSFLVVGVILSGAIDASFGLISLSSNSYEGWSRWQILWSKWFGSHAASNLIVAPLVFAWGGSLSQSLSVRRGAEIGVLVVVAATAGLVFLSDTQPSWAQTSPFARPFFRYPVGAILTPIIIVAALRCGQQGVTACVAAITGITLLYSTRVQVSGSIEPAVAIIHWSATIQGIVAACGMMMAGIASQCANAMAQRSDLNKKYQRLVETCSEGIWEVDASWKTTFVNPRMADMLGVTRDAMMGKHLFDFMDDSAKRTCEEYIARRESGIAELHDFRFCHASGRDVWMLLSTTPMFDDQGRITGAIALCTDITERKNTEDRMRASEERYRQLFEDNAAGAFVSSEDGSVRQANSAFAALFGYDSVEEVNAAPVGSFYADPDGRERYLSRLLRDGEVRNYELHYRRKDGTDGFAIENVRVLPGKQGQPRVFSGTLIDITDQRKAQEIIRQSEARFRTLVENAHDAFHLHAEDGSLIDVNSRACEMLGYSREELIGKKPPFWDPDVTPDEVSAIMQQLFNNESVSFRTRHRRKNGDLITVQVRLSPVIQDDRKLAVALVTDLTELLDSRERFQRVEARLQTVFRENPDCIFVVTSDGRLVETNPAGMVALEVTDLSTLKNQYLAEFVHAEDRASLNSALARAGDSNAEVVRIRLVGKKAGVRWMDVRTARLPSDPSDPWCIICVTRDVTSQVSAEEALRQSEKRLRAIFDQSIAGIFYSSEEGRQRGCNAAYARIYGFESPDELNSMPVEFFYPETRDREEFLNRLSLSGALQGYELRFRRKDGSLGVGLESVRLVHEQDGTKRIIGCLIDISDRIGAERSLRLSQERLRLAFEAGRLGGWSWNPDTDAIWCDEEACRHLGHTVESCPQTLTAFHQCVIPDDLPAVQEAFRGVAEDGALLDIRYRILGGDSIVRWIEDRGCRTARDNGAGGEFVGIRSDVTERMNMEAALRESESRFRQITESIREVFWLSDPRKNSVLYVSPAYQSIWGKTAEDLYAAPWQWWESIHPEDQPRIREAALSKQASGSYDETYRIIRPDGVLRWVRDRAFPVRDTAGTVIRIAGVAEDVTLEKTSHDMLRESETRLRAIFENAGVGIAEVDSHSRIIRSNQAFSQMLRYSPGELIGMAISDISHPKEMATNTELIARAIHGEIDRYSIRKRYIAKDGYEVWGDLTAVVRRDQMGALLSIISVIKDVTEEVRSENFKAGFQRILEFAASGRSLGEILEEAVTVQEARLERAICSILLCDDETNTLYSGASGRLDPDYVNAVNGLRIAPGAGCCGTAAAENRTVIVEDIELDPLWDNFRELARTHGLRACWSQPIRSGRKDVLGTFAMYYRSPRRPTNEDLSALEEIGHIVGIAIENHRAREALKASEARLRTIVETEPECVKLVSHDGRLLEMNPAGLRMVEADDSNALIGRQVKDLILPSDYATYQALHAKACNGEPGEAVFRIRGLRGTERWMETSSVPWRNDRGEITGVLSVTRDISIRKQAEDVLRAAHDELEARVKSRTAELAATNETLRSEIEERLRAEQKLRESEERFRLLYNSTFEGIVLHLDGRILEANTPIQKMFGYSHSELLTMSRCDLIASESRTGMREPLRGLLEDELTDPISITGVRKDGTRFPIELQVKEIPFESGKVRLTAIRDMTEHQRALELADLHREELAHVQRLSTMGEMATGLAHELNQPLTAIKNYTQGSVRRLLSGEPDIAPVVQAMEVVADQAQRAGEIVRRIREMVRKRDPQTSECDLVQLCRNSVVLLESELRRSRVSVDFQLPAESTLVSVDGVQMEQVIVNILKNACEALNEQPSSQRWILITVDQDADNGIKLIIEDNGPGIPEPIRSRVFDAFFSTKNQGMGMGLSISRSIVEAHGGRLVAQAAKSGGASFTVSLPKDRIVL